jgi:plastocyanin
MPANFTIQVRYRPNHTRKVHFAGGNGPNPGDVEVTESSTITFVKMPGSHDFVFASFSTSPGSDDFEKTVTNDQITVTDNDADPGTYEYTVCVYPAGDQSKPPVCSDPQIINKPE